MHDKAVYNIAVGMTLKELQDERNIDRDKLAAALDTDAQSISKIEHGELRMTAGELILMIDKLDLPWEDFIKRVHAKLPEAAKVMR
jgi:transcriptional regulator with XRE-family HTH domain